MSDPGLSALKAKTGRCSKIRLIKSEILDCNDTTNDLAEYAAEAIAFEIEEDRRASSKALWRFNSKITAAIPTNSLEQASEGH